MSLCQPVIWSMATKVRNSVVAIVRMRPQAILLAMITMRKSTHGFPFVSHIWDAYGAPLGGPELRYKMSHTKSKRNYISCLNLNSEVIYVFLCAVF